MNLKFKKEQYLIQLLKQDQLRMQALTAVANLNLPQAYIAAGFVRNLIWDDLHHFKPTALNDIDVIYFAPEENVIQEQYYQDQLQCQLPELNWQVKNQAYMHLKHQHQAYQSAQDAMSYWPEQETAIAVRLLADETIEIISIFPLEDIFDAYIRHNPKAPLVIFQQRLAKKQWQQHWTNLKLE